MNLILNYPKILVLATCFSRSEYLFGKTVQVFCGGLKDKGDPTHCFPVTESWGQKFACEETLSGLKENSMEKYTTARNRIVACYYWTGWDDPERRKRALERLAYIRRKQGDKKSKLGKYNLLGLVRWVPIIGKWPVFNKESDADWCSENTASLHILGGAQWVGDPHIRPDQLLTKMQRSSECKCIVNFYKYDWEI